MSAINPIPLPSLRAVPTTQTIDRKAETRIRQRREDQRISRLVEKHVLDLHASDDQREISAVIAVRMGISEVRVDRIMAALLLEHRSARHTLKCAVMGAVGASEEAAADVWRDEIDGFGRPAGRKPARTERGAA
ncbi:MAG: hypothetical protein ABFD60_13095 [Bryobacteraceae bacterium]